VSIFVISFGLLLSMMFLISHLKQDYPPPPEVLAIWVEHWGEGVMLPFFNIPAESYRGFQASIMLPFCLGIWMLMGGTGRLLALLFGGKHSFETYLRMTGFAFFTCWLIATFLDFLYSSAFNDLVLRGLQGEFGSLVDTLFQYFPPVAYTFFVWPGRSQYHPHYTDDRGFLLVESCNYRFCNFCLVNGIDCEYC